MNERVALKDHFRETRLFQSRVILALVICIVLSLTIIVRLIYLQIIDHEHFNTLSNDNRVNILPIPPTRGLIYDRNGVLLAQNLPSFNIELIPEQIKNIDETINELSKILPISEEDIQRFNKIRKQKSPFESIPLLSRLNEDELATFAINRHKFPGVDIAARLVRNYPLGSLGVHALGYVGRISEEELRVVDVSNYSGSSHTGKVGIEQSYEEQLHGQVGVRHVEVNALGRVLRVIKKTQPTPGKNIYLTLDTDLQQIAEKALEGKRGSLVAIEPSSGEILSFVSTPAYDPNLFVMGIDTETYAAFRDSEDKPLFNRALRGQYPPGSTLKPFVGLAGLEYNRVTADTNIFCGGWYSLRGDSHRYRDWKRSGHAATNLDKAIAESCDVYFYDLSLTLGIDLMHTFLKQFGFGKATGIDIKGELGALLPSRDWKRKTHNQPWFPGETLIAGIGQGYVLSTPLQLAHATAILANRGKNIRPHLVKAVQDPQNLSIIEVHPEKTDTIHFANPDHWDQMIVAMTEAVHGRHGTARNIGKDAPYLIAGKTGTAQVFSIKQDETYDAETLDERLKDHSLFIAYAPIENPEIAISVIVENGGSGSAAAAPIARTVMDAYLLKDRQPPMPQPEE